jgi:hypothetical protein
VESTHALAGPFPGPPLTVPAPAAPPAGDGVTPSYGRCLPGAAAR